LIAYLNGSVDIIDANLGNLMQMKSFIEEVQIGRAEIE